MNKIVRENYPVEKLPEDLRKGIAPGGTVRVTLEPTTEAPARKTLAELFQRIEQAKRNEEWPLVSAEDAVARIRALRDEWN